MELCSECQLEMSDCRCPPATASLMGMLREFRDANEPGAAATPDPDR